MPPNLQEVKLKFARRRSAKVMGSLAERSQDDQQNQLPQEGEAVRGILVTHHSNLASKIVAPQDLATYTPLRVGSIKSKLHVPFAGSIDTLRLFFTEMFVGITEETNDTAENNNESGATITTFGLHGDKVK
jgi:cleavage and polyadenylation specificity factor subunit 3